MVAMADRFAEAAEDCRRRREQAVDALVARARGSGQTEDRTYWSIIYDFEHAPLTTNRRQLADRGIEVEAPERVDAESLPHALDRLIRALARMGIYFIHTDHLDDRTLYRRIAMEIIDEQVREMPPSDAAVEFVDMLGTSPQDRATYLSVYADDRERSRAAEWGETLPPRAARTADRDRLLPRPQR